MVYGACAIIWLCRTGFQSRNGLRGFLRELGMSIPIPKSNWFSMFLARSGNENPDSKVEMVFDLSCGIGYVKPNPKVEMVLGVCARIWHCKTRFQSRNGFRCFLHELGLKKNDSKVEFVFDVACWHWVCKSRFQSQNGVQCFRPLCRPVSYGFETVWVVGLS